MRRMWQTHNSKLKWLVAIFVVIIIAAIIFTVWLVNHNRANHRNAQIAEASVQGYTGSSSKAISDYNNLIASSKNNTEKRKALMGKAVAAGVNGLYDDELSAAQQAYNIQPDNVSAALIADAYAGKGDTANAKKYYQIAISYANKINDSKAVANYQGKLKDLGNA